MGTDSYLGELNLCTVSERERLAPSPGTSGAKLCTSIVVLVAAFDYLFYREAPGVSVTVFGTLLVAALIWHRPGMVWDWTRGAAVLLVASSLAQSAVAINFCNAAALCTLFSVAMVEQVAKESGCLPAVGVLAVTALTRALARWKCLIELSDKPRPTVAGESPARTQLRIAKIIVPALFAVAPLALLMGSGNALVGSYLKAAVDTVGTWLSLVSWPAIDRIFLWCLVATGALTFLWPSINLRAGTICMKEWPTFSLPADETVSRLRTWVIVGLANILFFWANGLDAWFLWFKAKLPIGVNYSEFVHQGVYALIGTTILSAMMLTVLFQQHENVSRKKTTRALALVWIVQNLILIGSVCLRLKLYVEAYQLSVLRFHVCSFLALVVVGYVLLSWRILLGKSLNWLLATNSVSLFCLFYALQFVDVAGIVARYNVEHWLEAKTGMIDVEYLDKLGPSAFPSLARLHREAPTSQAACDAVTVLRREEKRRSNDGRESWRSWQWRENRLRNEVFSSLRDPTTPDR
jgi:hypothetical protein